MLPDMNRLKQLLSRLRDLELRLVAPHEEAILEVGKQAVREELTRLAHALHDNSYWHEAPQEQRHVG